MLTTECIRTESDILTTMHQGVRNPESVDIPFVLTAASLVIQSLQRRLASADAESARLWSELSNLRHKAHHGCVGLRCPECD